jgi:hypothetical protein
LFWAHRATYGTLLDFIFIQSRFIRRNKRERERASWAARSLVRWRRGQLQRILECPRLLHVDMFISRKKTSFMMEVESVEGGNDVIRTSSYTQAVRHHAASVTAIPTKTDTNPEPRRVKGKVADAATCAGAPQPPDMLANALGVNPIRCMQYVPCNQEAPRLRGIALFCSHPASLRGLCLCVCPSPFLFLPPPPPPLPSSR